MFLSTDRDERSDLRSVQNQRSDSLVKNITAKHIILSSIVETNKNEPVDNGNNF